MSEAINDGGPVYPVRLPVSGALHVNDEPAPTELHTGKSLRDKFAGLALQGLCANPGGPFQANPMCGWGIVNCTPDDVAERAYDLADAMIRARDGGAA